MWKRTGYLEQHPSKWIGSTNIYVECPLYKNRLHAYKRSELRLGDFWFQLLEDFNEYETNAFVSFLKMVLII